VTRIPRWRLVAAVVVLAALVVFAAVLTPIYFRSLKFARFVATLPESAESPAGPAASATDAGLRERVVEQARALDLPVDAGEVAIARAPGDGRLESVSVHYTVRVEFPGYTVDLHFSPRSAAR
jgi:hypothetical protein